METGRVQLQVGPVLCEVLTPAVDEPALRARLGQEAAFHTLLYLEGDAARGNLEPRLVGFLRAEDRAFFDLFVTVKGIGPRRALRALAAPVARIASAIEARDSRFLVGLPEIGKRTAEQVIAELAGKLKDFAVAAETGEERPELSNDEQEAVAALVALGERRSDAELLLERARRAVPAGRPAADLVREMLRIRNA